jgi:hypothetical protein
MNSCITQGLCNGPKHCGKANEEVSDFDMDVSGLLHGLI